MTHSGLVRRSSGSDIAVVTDDCNVLGGSGACLDGRWALFAKRIYDKDGFVRTIVYLCRTATWRSNSTGTLNQVNYIAVGYR